MPNPVPARARRVQRFHSYVISLGLFGAKAAAIAFAGGIDQGTFVVDTGYDFHLMKLQAFIYDANGLQVSTLQSPRLTVILQDGSSKQGLTDNEVPIAALFGTGQIPYILPVQHRIVGGSTFNATVKNTHTATAFSVDLVFSGMHVAKVTV